MSHEEFFESYNKWMHDNDLMSLAFVWPDSKKEVLVSRDDHNSLSLFSDGSDTFRNPSLYETVNGDPIILMLRKDDKFGILHRGKEDFRAHFKTFDKKDMNVHIKRISD